jgi:antitoxin component YwqK of YwqJK toxin-antitoxin module
LRPALDGWQGGLACDWYASGELKSEAMYRKSARNGPSREFRKDGSLISDEFYVANLLVKARSFDETGAVTEEFELSPGDPSYATVKRLSDEFGHA